MASHAVDRNAFFADLKNSGQRIVASFGAGGQRANETGLAFKEVLWPYLRYCDADFTSSGGGIGVACCAAGYSPAEVGRYFSAASLKDIVDVYDRGSVIMRNIQRFRSSGLGVNSGDKLRTAIRRIILQRLSNDMLPLSPQSDRDTFANVSASPSLHVLATPCHVDDNASAFVFSRENTPEASISRAVMASSAEMLLFQRQKVRLYRNGVLEDHEFSDAGAVEPLPLVSVLNDHESKGYPASDLTILGIIPTYDFTPVPSEASAMRHLVRAVVKHFRTLIINQIRYVTACGARVIVLEPSMSFIKPFIPAPKNITERTYREINIAHFAACYPWILEVVEQLFDMAVQAYFQNPDKRIIAARMDQRGRAIAEAFRKI
jgi:hypothetical protein